LDSFDWLVDEKGNVKKIKQMEHKAKSIRPFIGAKNFEVSRHFYQDWGFEEVILEHNMSVFKTDGLAFYLQNYYIKDWIDNTMIFLEVEDVSSYWNKLVALNLPDKYKEARISPIKVYDWGKECFVHDPSGILWHIGEFFS
jgi:hypothetical protein